jgi:hypothetical protein
MARGGHERIDPDLIDGKPFAATPWLKPINSYLKMPRLDQDGTFCRFG